MARSPTGTFTLVAGNPVVTGTIITSDWANTTMPDIGAALTDSLSRTGQGGMLAPIRGVGGSATAPAHSFTDFPRSGMYAIGANEMRYAVNGVDRMRWQAGGLPTQTYNVATGLWEDLEPVGVVGPNLLDNTNFQILQRGRGASYGVSEYLADRWRMQSADFTSVEQVIGAISYDDPRFVTTDYHRTSFSSPTGPTPAVNLVQHILDVKQLNDATFTLSARIRIAVGNKVGIDIVIDYGVGGSPDESFIADALYDGSGDFDLAEFQMTIPSFAGKTFGTNPKATVFFHYCHPTKFGGALAGQTGVFEIAEVKLEKGSVRTRYEPTPVAQDEAECQKWLQVYSTNTPVSQASMWNNTDAYGTITLSPPMHFVPAAGAMPNNSLTLFMNGVTNTEPSETTFPTRTGINIKMPVTGRTSGDAGFFRVAGFVPLEISCEL